MGAARHTSAPEPTGLCLDDSKRPDGITLFSWKHGMQLVWDVTCPDTLAQSYLHLTSKEAGKAAEKAEKEKMTDVQRRCLVCGWLALLPPPKRVLTPVVKTQNARNEF